MTVISARCEGARRGSRRGRPARQARKVHLDLPTRVGSLVVRSTQPAIRRDPAGSMPRSLRNSARGLTELCRVMYSSPHRASASLVVALSHHRTQYERMLPERNIHSEGGQSRDNADLCPMNRATRRPSSDATRQVVRVTTESQRDSRAARMGPVGSGARTERASAATRRRSSLRGLHRRVGAQQGQRLGVQRVIGEVAVEQGEQPRGRRGRADDVRRTCSTGSVGTPSRRSVPGILPDRSASEVTSRMSSESWKAVPIRSPNRVIDVDHRVVGPGEHRAETARGRDQRAGLVRDDREVVLDRIVAVGRARRSRGSAR